MTGPEHYRRAEQLMESTTRKGKTAFDPRPWFPIPVRKGCHGSSACRPRAGRCNGG
jgi:hypothetical protein